MAKIVKALFVEVDDQPGAGEKIFSSLGVQRVNVDAVNAWSFQGKASFHLVVNDAEKAKAALREYNPQEQDSVMHELENTPGAGAAMLKKLSEAGLNLSHLYCTTNPGNASVVFSCNDNAKAVDMLNA